MNNNDYLKFGKYTKGCQAWLLDKVRDIDDSNIDISYVIEVLKIIADEFNSEKYKVKETHNITESRFVCVKDILDRRQNSCGSMASVVASVFRSLNIPTKLVHGRYVKNNPNMRHAWNEILINNEWLPFDVTNQKNDFKLSEFHVKCFDAVDWGDFENCVEKF